MQTLIRHYSPPFLLLVLLVGIWEGAVKLFETETYILPAPSLIWKAFMEVSPTLPEHIETTMVEALAGLGLAIVIGPLLAILIFRSAFLRRVLYPLLVVSQNIPVIVLAPILVIWMGFGIMPKVVVVALVGFFPIVVNTVEALNNTEQEMVELVKSMGAGQRAILQKVLIPAAIPGFFSGLKIAATYAILGAVIGEWSGASSGLGIFINRSQAAFRLDQIFVAIVIIASLSIALFGSVGLLARFSSPWKYISKQGD
jgi:ABC-type nitrate/sulfonate/bicarbonate transport system permease component